MFSCMERVSIPYRITKNNLEVEWKKTTVFVSIPYRITKN